MKIKNVLFLILFFTVLDTIQGQSTDLMRIDYTYIPLSNGDNEYSRFRISMNYPIKVNEKKSAYFIISPQYRHNTLSINDELIFDQRKDINVFQNISLELGYTFKMKKEWRFGAKLGAGIASNFEGASINRDDFRYTGSLFFVKSYKDDQGKKKSRLVLGLRYTTPASINFPVPIINYFNQFHPKWSYALGTPKTSIKHMINKKNSLQAFIGVDRFYGNLQNNRTFVDQNGRTKIAENASMLNVIGALGYEYYFTEHLLFYCYAGHTLSNQIRLRNGNQENVLVIDDTNTFYVRSGIKFKI